MSNIALIWDAAEARGDWMVLGGGIATGHVLRTAVLISLFTDRRAPDGSASADPRGWWQDSFDSVPIGSRLWQLRRRKVADRARLVSEATDMARECLQWLIDDGLATAVAVNVAASAQTAGSAGSAGSGVVLDFAVTLRQPDGSAPVVRALWRAETGGDRL